MYLPATQEAESQTVAGLEAFTGQGELILIVDDEAMIVEITKATLETHNYKTLTARDGIEAIACYARSQEPVRLVLMDMMMPAMEGRVAISTLEKLDPQVQIVAMSGLPAREALAQMQNYGVKAFLSKPFTANELLHTLHSILYSQPHLVRSN